jgi:hypothetical protein
MNVGHAARVARMKRSAIREWCYREIIPGLRRDAPASGLRLRGLRLLLDMEKNKS